MSKPRCWVFQLPFRFCTGHVHRQNVLCHYYDVIMNTIASQITSLTIVYLTVNSGTDQRKHQSSASLAFVRGIHRRPVNSPHKGPVTRKMFPFDDVIMQQGQFFSTRITGSSRSGSLFTKRRGILPPALVMSRSFEIDCWNYHFVLKLDRCFSSIAAEAIVEF